MKKRIDVLIFGGSFDPIHEGHLHMLKAAISECVPEHVVVIPNYVSPLKSQTLFSTTQRLNMTQKVISDTFNTISIEVSDIEVNSETKSYTVNTLESLSQQYPNKTLGFLCGSDSALSFHKWVKPDRILDLATCIVILRETDSRKDVETYFKTRFHLDNVMILNSPLHPASSTQIRSEILNKSNVLNHVPRGIESLVKEYINDNRSDR